MIGTFLGELLIKDVTIEPGKLLVTHCEKYGWTTFQPQLKAVMKSTTTETMERNVRLLEQVCTAKPKKKAGWGELCKSLAQEYVSAMEAVDQQTSPVHWRSGQVKRSEVLAGLVRALVTTGQSALLDRVVAHVLGAPKVYPLIDVQMPALAKLQPWLKKNVEEPCKPLTRWLASCREQLEALTAHEPQKPADFRREANISCKCENCAELKRFLADPKESVHRFRMREDLRNHLEFNIKGSHCDLNLHTDRSGSPYTLVCTKNTASYEAKLKTYHQNLEHLATVQAVETSLSK